MVSQFGSLGYTIMEKTAGLTVVQKTIIDTLHKEGKPQTFIAKEAGCSQSAVSKHVNRKLSGRKKCGRKRCTINRENCHLMRIVKQNRFKNLGEVHKEWTEAGVKASRATTHRRVKEFGYSCHQRRLTWSKEKKIWTVTQWSKVLFSCESKFCISFGNQGPRVCWCWSIVFFENHRHCTRLPRNFGALHASFCWPAFQRCWFHFPAGLSRRPLSKKPGLPYHISSATNWSPPCQKYWVHIQKMNILSRKPTIHKFFYFILLVLWSILICWDSELVGFC